MSFLDFGFLDLIDILLVAFLLYQIYRLVKGTVAINIFIGVAAIYLLWKLVEALQMELLSEILGQFIGVGVLALVIVFQQEIRKFLLVLGSTNFSNGQKIFRQLNWFKTEEEEEHNFDAVYGAVERLSETKTGAIIAMERKTQLGSFSETGTIINAVLSSQLLESIFFKNSSLHDGAVIISGNRIVAAGAILPVTEKTIPMRFGLRHRAAIGAAEKSDAVVLVVSEETGDISIAAGEIFQNKVRLSELKAILQKYFAE